MREKATEYFHKNREKMNFDDMVRNLRNEGVGESDIEEAREAVFGNPAGAPTQADYDAMWNLCKHKEYTHFYQKLGDLVIGIFGFSLPLCLSVYLDHFIGFIIAWAIYILQIIGIFYFWNRRRYISVGCIIATLFVPIILFGIFVWFWQF